MKGAFVSRPYVLRTVYLLATVGLGVEAWASLLRAAWSLQLSGATAHRLFASAALIVGVGLRHPAEVLPLLLSAVV